MSALAGVVQPQQTQQTAPAQAAKGARIKPFCQSAKVATRLVGNFQPAVSAAPAPIGPVALTPSGGYVKRWILEWILSGGGGTTPGVFAADGPWNLASLVTLAMPNNNPILNLTGYNLYLADIYGGYAMGENPANDPDYSTASGNANIWPYIPIELDPTGLGAQSDLSSSSGYQLYVLPSPDGTVYSTLPSPLPTAALNVLSEHWTLPDTKDDNGVPQEIAPPAAGTIQQWNQILNVLLSAGGGQQYFQMQRMGNQLRTVIMVTRSSGARSDSPFPNPFRLDWDDVILRNQSPQTIRKDMYESTLSQAARPAGVHALFYNKGINRYVGGNGASSWFPTVTDTRYALDGSFPAATAPTVDWVVNEVAYAPLGNVARSTTGGSGPGYHPPAGA